MNKAEDGAIRAVIRSLMLASVLVIVRNILVLSLSPYGSIEYALGSVAGIPETAILFLVPLWLMNRKSSSFRFAGLVLVTGLVILHQLCIHYELVFGRLPGISILYYVGEIKHLLPSINDNLPVWLFVLEAAGILLLWRVAPKQLVLTRLPAVMLVVTMFVSAAAVNRHPELLPEGSYWASRTALGWMVQSTLLQRGNDLEGDLETKDIWEFQRITGQIFPKGGHSKQYLLCAQQKAPLKPNDRSVIILFLEGVGQNEMNLEVDGAKVMPNLADFVSNYASFNNAHAPGTKSSQAMVSVFTGLHAQPIENILWTTPMPHVQSFVSSLAKNGYESGFFHGGDLSFEQQRSFLKSVGFDHITEYDSASDLPVYGWGYDDAEVFKMMQEWIKLQNDKPYLASLFSLSSHDPYVVPPSWKAGSSSGKGALPTRENWPDQYQNDTVQAMIESYNFLDFQFGEFITWYEKEERVKGTVLIVLGDHTPHYWNESQDSVVREMTFKVPLVFASNDITEASLSGGIGQRLATLADIPSTLAGLLGTDPGACDQGVDLFQQEWLDDRLIYSVGGDSQERLYLFNQYGKIVYDRMTGKLNVLELTNGLSPNHELFELLFSGARRFISLLFPINQHQIDNNGYAPDDSNMIYSPVEPAVKPIVVSHRANIDGEQSQSQSQVQSQENSRSALTRVIESGFDWVEIDFQVTADGIPVGLHDGYIEVSGQTVAVSELSLHELRSTEGFEEVMTLDEVLLEFGQKINILIEAKQPPNKHISYSFMLANYIAKAVKNYAGGKQIIVDSFSSVIASSINQGCDCSVGMDAPYQQKLDEGYLRSLALKEIEWVYVHYSVVDKELIDSAHSYGIKVMAYTVNDPAILHAWGDSRPDGIITDSLKIHSVIAMP